jgi:hypothetical protein
VSFVNLPDSLFKMFSDIRDRLDKLERSNRFTAPNVATDPTNPRPGDIWLNTTSNTLKAVDKNGAVKTITWV